MIGIEDKPSYERKVNKNEIPVCNIMGVNIATVCMEWLVNYLEKNIDQLHGEYMCVANVHPSQNPLDTFPQG